MGPLSWAVPGKHRFKCSGDAEDRGEWPLAQTRWCCKKRTAECSADAKAKNHASMLSTTSRSDVAHASMDPHMGCKGHQSQEFRDWCCSHQDVFDGCHHRDDSLAPVPALSVGPPPPRPAGPTGGSAAEAGAGGEGRAWPVPEDMAKVSGCDTLCEYHGEASTCRFRIQWAATHEFLWRDSACRQSYEAVLAVCPHCSSCTLAVSSCVTPAPTTGQPPTTASMRGAVKAAP